ncbi:DUF3000 domain-containing protein [Embleya scabrispora]|uniref:DUF3000 domain-containing protein n=1 Tax=Embleya scabrispora TaxID=159449 RepID=UPI000365ED8F|nr:DUF3000 domain-containing protein [Embleya scabrispora]MYS79520.1 DUF3000 family protein [Streptomyces sp. SID5474]
MAAVGETEEPEEFRQALAGWRAANLRPEIVLEEMSRPRGLAPFSAAFAAEVALGEDEDELAGGRIVLLHDPAGHEAWEGTFRVVTMTRAELEPELAMDPLLPEVGWTWLTESLHAVGAAYRAPSGTVSRSTSQGFGGLSGQIARTEIEIRASWTPTDDELLPHLLAWTELMCTCAGLPPVVSGEGVVAIPRRPSRPGS